MDRQWILATLLIALIVGAGLLVTGTILEWLRLSKLFDITLERLISLGVVVLGAFILFSAYVFQLYLFSHHEITLFHIGEKRGEPLFE